MPVREDTGELIGTMAVPPHRPEPCHCTSPDHRHHECLKET
jgi:hypothetical protein